MPSLAAARAANAAFSPSYLPVAVFRRRLRGTSRATPNHPLWPQPCCRRVYHRVVPQAQHAGYGRAPRFVQCDVSLMQNIEDVSSALRARLPRLNFLVLSPGMMNFRGRDETSEGIDRRLGLHYYTRWKFTHDLLPLLRSAKDAGQDAKVMTVLAAGVGGKVDLDDLGLKKHYSLSGAGLASPTYSDLMIESFAEQNPDMSFVHIAPGVVRTNLIRANHWIQRPLIGLLTAVIYPISVSPAECGEYMLWGLLQAQNGSSRRNSKGDDIGMARYFGSEEARKALWEHTVNEMKRATSIGTGAEARS
ncbi:hypothetical protein B0H21DRAFT_781073 [Amylocystis lapponica]|nr:hypothetical protein B0H21DRAFT_781073 [Amylocystis lapponica]